jgi:hypothetical protein
MNTIELVVQTRIGGWGSTFYDPANEVAKVIADFNKTKTLTIDVLKICKSIGMAVKVLPVVDQNIQEL